MTPKIRSFKVFYCVCTDCRKKLTGYSPMEVQQNYTQHVKTHEQLTLFKLENFTNGYR
jgi:hypothetical protein